MTEFQIKTHRCGISLEFCVLLTEIDGLVAFRTVRHFVESNKSESTSKFESSEFNVQISQLSN